MRAKGDRSSHRGRKRRHQRNRRENLARERMQYDLGFFDHESVRVECAPNSFELKCYQCVRIWTPPHLLAPRVLATRYDCSRISGLGVTSIIRGGATMGYSRVGSSLERRAWRP